LNQVLNFAVNRGGLLSTNPKYLKLRNQLLESFSSKVRVFRVSFDDERYPDILLDQSAHGLKQNGYAAKSFEIFLYTSNRLFFFGIRKMNANNLCVALHMTLLKSLVTPFFLDAFGVTLHN